MQQEIWKEVKDYPGLYEVSNLGRVRSFSVDAKQPRLLRPKKTKEGYLSYVFCKDNKKRSFLAHRLVLRNFTEGNHSLTCDHIDMDKSNNCLENLRYITRQENIRRSQADLIMCEHLDGRILTAQGTRLAAEVTKCNRGSVVNCLKTGKRNRKGWSYKIVVPKKS